MHAGYLGDHIGMESCVDLETDTAAPLSSGGGGGTVDRKRWGMSRRSSISGKKKELPPPLPIQMSTVMKRYYTDDGRLIIREEKVESPKYLFTAHRSHGRLTLQLVPSESSCAAENKCSSCEKSGEEKEKEKEKKISAEDEYRSNKVAVVGGGSGDCDGGSRGGGTYFSYNTAVRVAATGSCLLVNQNQLPAIRPVRI